MPNDPRHSRFVTVKGHAGTLVIDTHADQLETMPRRAKKNDWYPVPDNVGHSISRSWKKRHEAGMLSYCRGKDKDQCPTENQWGKELRHGWAAGWCDARRLDRRGKLDKEDVIDHITSKPNHCSHPDEPK
jgi:hypothetical protein